MEARGRAEDENIKITVEMLKSRTGQFDLESILFLKLKNIVCMNTSYQSAILEIFPKIKVLDGERMSGRGSDLYQLCKDMDASLKEMRSSGSVGEWPGTKKWVEDGYWELRPKRKTQSDEAVEQFYNIVKECRELNSKAADIIAKTERTLCTIK